MISSIGFVSTVLNQFSTEVASASRALQLGQIKSVQKPGHPGEGRAGAGLRKMNSQISVHYLY